MDAWIISIISVVVGAFIGFFFSLILKKLREKEKKERLKRIIREELDLISLSFKAGEKRKLTEWLEVLHDPEKHIWISRILPYGYMVEDLDQELFLLDDPIPKGVLLLRRCIKRYQYLHMILEQMIDKLILDCSSYEECVLTLRQNKNKERLQPTIAEMENQRKKTVEVADSLRALLD